MSRILVVDDDPQILRTLRINLRARGHQVSTAAHGSAALTEASETQPELIVLDLGLPDMDGVDVIRQLRRSTAVPIIVLSGRSDSGDKVNALDVGADDYVTKPFGIDELLARIRAVTRRSHAAGNPASVVAIGRWQINLETREIQDADGTTLRLTPTEWHLLDILARQPGKLVTQRELLHEVWGPAYTKETHYLRQYVTQLRHKLEPDPARPQYLVTEPGMGYRLRPDHDT
jgi:two-component system KDP operon response regulator KdpE